MALTLTQFSQLPVPAVVVVHSLEQALYQVTLLVDGQEHLLTEDSGRPFRKRSLQAVRDVLRVLPVASVTLRHQSAYDEMIGQPPREGDNTLEVALSLEDYPQPVIH
ncbi:MAG: DUF6482 family protein [Gammaproteobacteria bacterium]|nr:DUF6482 family protein [Gammaproteobacteria bacterium]